MTAEATELEVAQARVVELERLLQEAAEEHARELERLRRERDALSAFAYTRFEEEEGAELPVMFWASASGWERVRVRACNVKVLSRAFGAEFAADPRELFTTIEEANQRVAELHVQEQFAQAYRLFGEAEVVHAQLQELQARYDSLRTEANGLRLAATTRQQQLRKEKGGE